MVMRNRILAITRGSIPYVPELRPIAGSVTATILMQQLDYWFERHPLGFYKFQDVSADNAAYKPGDSWAEELNFSVAELRNAFDQIGHRHKSKTEWNDSTDPFNGKFYCCYTDRRTRLTFYFRNHAMVDAALDALVAKQGPSMPPPPHPMRPPIHAKTAGNTHNLDRKVESYTVSSQSESPVNVQTQFTRNEESSLTVNKQDEATASSQTQHSHIDKVRLPEVQPVNSAYTENTGLQKTTQRPQQQLPEGLQGGDDTAIQRSGGCDDDIFERLVFPKAEPIELKHLADLVVRCRLENQQSVLDEVEGARQRATLRSGIVPFARALVKAEADGLFTASAGVAVRAARELATRNAQSAMVTPAETNLRCETLQKEESHLWTPEEINMLPPKMRERLLLKIGQGVEVNSHHH